MVEEQKQQVKYIQNIDQSDAQLQFMQSLQPDQPYKIISKSSGKPLQVENNDKNDLASFIIIQKASQEKSQIFYFDPADQNYFFIRCAHSNKVLDINDASQQNCGQLIQFEKHGGDNQKFKLVLNSDGTVGFQAKHSGLFLDVYCNQSEDGTKIIQYQWHGGENQLFNIEIVTCETGQEEKKMINPNQLYKIISVSSQKALDVIWASQDDYAILIIYQPHEGKNQQFYFDASDDDEYFFIRCAHSNKIFDIKGNSTQNMANLIQYTKHGGNNQQFKLCKQNDGSFGIQSKHSGLFLDVNENKLDDYTEIIQFQWHGGKNQLFKILEVSEAKQLPKPQFKPQQFYQIFSASSGKALDILSASQADSALLIIYSPHNGQNQRFYFDQIDEDYFFIRCAHSDKVLDVEGNSNQQCARLLQWTKHGGANQQFKFYQQQDGSFGIQAKNSGLYLDVFCDKKDNCTQIIQYQWHGGLNQRFIIKEISTFLFEKNKQYGITSISSGKSLDIRGNSKEDYASVIIYTFHGGQNQRFYFDQIDDDWCFIRCAHSNKVLDIEGNSTNNSARLIQFNKHGGDNQQFRIEQQEDGSYIIYSKKSGLVLDVQGNKTDDYTQIVQYTLHGKLNQKFIIKKL